MYAVVEIAGKQFIVEKGDQILAPKLEGEMGQEVHFEKVLLTSHEDNVMIGEPIIDGAQVKATIMNNERGDKVYIFKKKRRKGYQVKKGHRQDFTRLRIDEIITGGSTHGA